MNGVTAAVLGAGSWGTAYAKVLADAGCAVTLWARRGELAAVINDSHTNPTYLPGIRLPSTLTATDDVATAVRGATIVVLAVPAQTMRANITSWASLLPANQTIISLAKGVELSTCARMSEVIASVGIPLPTIAVVSGPNLAAEIAAEQPAATVIACADSDRARWLQQLSATNYLRPYTNTDVLGCELAGAAKNVIALAAGISVGMGLGDNTKASLMTRGLAEISRLGVAMGAQPETFAGLAGMGDLVATCMSPLSRNHQFGMLLAQGKSLAQATEKTKTAEGVWSCVALAELARTHGVEMPITEQIVRVCHQGLSAVAAVTELMSRKPKPEQA